MERKDVSIPPWGAWWSHPFPTWPHLLSDSSPWGDLASQLREELGIPLEVPWIATGHQPWPFHPGIAAKVIAIWEAARTWGWWASFHLQTHAPVSDFSYPTWKDQGVVWAHPFAQSTPYETFEGILPSDAMRREAEAILQALELPQRQPQIRANWHILSSLQTNRLGKALQAWVFHWLGNPPELHPLSTYQIFTTDTFLTFFQRVLQNPVGLHRAIQDALERYRKRHRIRTRAQPFADLKREDPWIEIPFWWIEKSTRESLWIHSRSGALRVRDREVGHRDAPSIRGKVFPKALMLTLFYRYVAVNLFIHGLGGMHYDEVTDDIARWLGFSPRPRVAVTLSLGLIHENCSIIQQRIHSLRERLKHLQFRAERVLPPDHPLRIRKNRLIEAFQTASGNQRSALHQEITALNQSLLELPEVQAKKREWEAEIQELEYLYGRCQWRVFREYPFYFFDVQEVHHALFGPQSRPTGSGSGTNAHS